MAYTLRGRYTGVPGLELAATVHWQSDADQAGGDLIDTGLLLSTHLIWSRGPFTLKALWAGWEFEGDAIEAAGGDRQDGWYVEPSFKPVPNLGVYARYEDVDGFRTADGFSQWEVGMNWWPHEDVVLKVDYRDRNNDTDSGLDDKGFDIGIGYQF